MRRILSASLSVFFLLLVSCSFSEALNGSQPVRDGYWWNIMSPELKLGFVVGYVESMTEVNITTQQECILEVLSRKAKTIGEMEARDKARRQCIDDRWDFTQMAMGQFREALDEFYSDFRNKTVDINKAIAYVRDQLKGKSTAKLEKELKGMRDAARQKHNE